MSQRRREEIETFVVVFVQLTAVGQNPNGLSRGIELVIGTDMTCGREELNKSKEAPSSSYTSSLPYIKHPQFPFSHLRPYIRSQISNSLPLLLCLLPQSLFSFPPPPSPARSLRAPCTASVRQGPLFRQIRRSSSPDPCPSDPPGEPRARPSISGVSRRVLFATH